MMHAILYSSQLMDMSTCGNFSAPTSENFSQYWDFFVSICATQDHHSDTIEVQCITTKGYLGKEEDFFQSSRCSINQRECSNLEHKSKIIN